MIYAFGEFELDLRQFRLRRSAGGGGVDLDRKAFDTLVFLVENRYRAVTRTELLERVWSGTTVVDSVVPSAVVRLRRALGQPSDAQEPIETLRGRGYRFVSEVSIVDDAEPAPAAANGAPSNRADDSGRDPDPFVGRSEALDRLTLVHQSARAGRGRFVLCVGQSGIGKTRLVRHFLRTIEPSDATWTARCQEGEATPPLWPWTQLLRSAYRSLAPGERDALPGGVLDDLSALVPELSPLGKTTSTESVLGSKTARMRLYDGTAWFFRALAEKRPRVLVIEDLQWADSASLELTEFFARSIDELRVLLIGTTRLEPAPNPTRLSRELERASAEPVSERIELGTLSEAEVGEYVRSALRTAPEDDVQRALFRRSAGNPRELREAVRALALTDAADRAAPQTSAASFPGGLGDFRRRLEGFSLEVRRVLTVASAFDRPFSLATLDEVSDVRGAELRQALDDAERAGVLRRLRNVTRWEFSHDVFRDAIYAETGAAERARVHFDLALALERHRAALGVTAAEIAIHFQRSLPHEHVDRAVSYAREAARTADETRSHDSAARFYEMALDALSFDPGADPRQAAELWLAFGRALVASGRPVEAQPPLAHARELGRSLGDPVLLAHVALAPRRITRVWHPSEPGALDALREALIALPPGERDLRARILASISMSVTTSMEERKRQLREAMELSLGSTERDTIVAVQVSRLGVLEGPEHAEALNATAEEIMRFAATENIPELGLAARTQRTRALLTLGKPHAALAECSEIERIGHETHNPVTGWSVTIVRAGIALAQGRFDEAERSFLDGLTAGQRFYGEPAVMLFLGQMSELAATRGQMRKRAPAELDRMRRRFGWAGFALEVHLATVAHESGQVDSARTAFERLARLRFEDAPRGLGYLTTLWRLAHLAVNLEDQPRAEQLLMLLLPYAHLNAASEYALSYGAVAHAAGVVEDFLGRTNDARRHYEQAVDLNDAMGFVPAATRSRGALGHLLARSPERWERVRGAELIRAAGDRRREIGIQEPPQNPVTSVRAPELPLSDAERWKRN